MNKLGSGSSICKAIQFLHKQLFKKYTPEEITSFSNLIFKHLLNYSKIEIQLNKNRILGKANIDEYNKIFSEIVNYVPIQYVLGHTEFYDLKIFLNRSVLIPRPETEELVDWIIKDNFDKNPNILDIGTGSGCIAISIAKNLIYSTITALDFSEEILKISKSNAEYHKTNICFRKYDILKYQESGFDRLFDVIVSNPPYVMESEKKLMKKNVLNYEPESALFVSDDKPLLYYSAICGFAKKHLAPGGMLYFEINENLGNEVLHLLKTNGFNNVELKKDISGKDRMVKALFSIS